MARGRCRRIPPTDPASLLQVGLELGMGRNKRTKISQIRREAKKYWFLWKAGRVTKVMTGKAVSLLIIWLIIWKGEGELDKKKIGFCNGLTSLLCRGGALLFCTTSHRLCWQVVHCLTEVPSWRGNNPPFLSLGGEFLHPQAHTGDQPPRDFRCS